MPETASAEELQLGALLGLDRPYCLADVEPLVVERSANLRDDMHDAPGGGQPVSSFDDFHGTYKVNRILDESLNH